MDLTSLTNTCHRCLIVVRSGEHRDSQTVREQFLQSGRAYYPAQSWTGSFTLPLLSPCLTSFSCLLTMAAKKATRRTTSEILANINCHVK